MSKFEIPEISKFTELATDEKFSINKDGVVKVDRALSKEWLALSGLNEDTVKHVEQFQVAVASATGDLLRQRGLPVMKENKAIDRIVAKVPTVGYSNVQVALDRTKTSRNPRTGEKTDTFGVLSAKVNNAAVKASNGGFSAVKQATMEQAAKLLK